MMFGFDPKLLLLVFLFGGSNDLLDYVPPDAYWQARHVDISREAMAAELAPGPTEDASKLIDELSNADPQTRDAASRKLAKMGPKVVPQLRNAADTGDPQTASLAEALIKQINLASKGTAVRRLMAIRTLGDMKDKSAIDVLKPLLESKAQFEADYAAAAIATLEGRPSTRPAPTAATRAADAWSIPDSCGAVIQMAARSSRPVSLSTLAVQLMPMMGPNENQKQMADQINGQLIQAVDKIGNVRMDTATIGISSQIGDRVGHIVILFRGSFDARAVAADLQARDVKSQATGGVDVYDMPDDTELFMVGDDRLVLVFGPNRPDAQLLGSIISAITAGKNDLRASKDLSSLLAAADASLPVWGVAKITPSFRQAPILAPFDTISLASKPDGKMIDLTLTANSADADGAKAAVSEFNNDLQQIVGEMHQAAGMVPFGKPAIAIFESVKSNVAGGNATVTAQLPQSMVAEMSAAPATQPANP